MQSWSTDTFPTIAIGDQILIIIHSLGRLNVRKPTRGFNYGGKPARRSIIVVDSLGKCQHNPQEQPALNLSVDEVDGGGAHQDGWGVDDYGWYVDAGVDVDLKVRPKNCEVFLDFEVKDGSVGIELICDECGIAFGWIWEEREDECGRVDIGSPENIILEVNIGLLAFQLQMYLAKLLPSVVHILLVNEVNRPHHIDLVVQLLNRVKNEHSFEPVKHDSPSISDIGYQFAAILRVD